MQEDYEDIRCPVCGKELVSIKEGSRIKSSCKCSQKIQLFYRDDGVIQMEYSPRPSA